jgi:hypothetical protein
MPAEHLIDKLIGCLTFSPFKCRACRSKFYRRSTTVSKPPATPPVAESAPAPNVAVCHRDIANTLQRVEQIIQVAEGARLRKG